MVKTVLRVGLAPRERALRRLSHDGLGVLAQLRELRARGDLRVCEKSLEASDRVALEPFLELAWWAVGTCIGAGVTLLAIREGLEQRRAFAVARASRCCGGRLADGEHVVSVHAVSRHGIRGGALGEVRDGRGARERRVLAVEIVLT